MHPASPLVSIITPAYRAQATLGRAVRSVLAQTHTAWEMLIVSDEGTDYRTLLAHRAWSIHACGSSPPAG